MTETLQALEGLRQHDSLTEDTFECLQTDNVPKEWERYAYPCHTDLSCFVTNLQSRVEYITELMNLYANKKAG